jgi:hypothetical protein
MTYWLDADTFITAKNSLYAFEVNTTLWAWFDIQLKAKTIALQNGSFEKL